jgi:signal transduction histidine kinase
MRVGQRLILGFLVVVVLAAILGGVNIVSIKNISTETETHHTLHMPIRAAITHIRIDIEEIVRATEEYDAGWMTEEESFEEISEKKGHIETYLERLFATTGLLTREEVEYLKSSINEFYDLSAELILLHGKTRAERLPVMEAFDEKVEEIDNRMDVLLKTVDEASKESTDSIMSTIASSRIISISVLIVAILGALGTAFVISRSILNPVTELRNAAIEIGNGDLSKRAKVKSTDEIGELATSFNQMTENLEKSRDEIQQQNQKLEVINEELRVSNEELRATEEELRTTNEELQSANDELIETQEQLVRSEKLAAIGQLASGVGHELRNPLGAIKNAVFYIKRRITKTDLPSTEPRALEFLNLIEEEVDAANKVISDLLGFSRVAKPTVSPVSIAGIIEDALKHTPITENIDVAKDIDENLSRVMVDADQIRQVFINIVVNALQAMTDGGRLEIRAQSQGEFVEVEFGDTGPGIHESVIKKIFDPLFTTKAKGIGLGLSVCQSIMERHGGDIRVENREGGGTTFTVSLPTQ